MGSPNVINLGSITNLQTMQGIILTITDGKTPPNQVALPAAPNPVVDQGSALQIKNVKAVAGATPPMSQFTFDATGIAPSNGPVNITAQTQQANGDAGFSGQLQLTVTLDPSTPGPASEMVVTVGTIIVTSTGNVVIPAPTTPAGQTP